MNLNQVYFHGCSLNKTHGFPKLGHFGKLADHVFQSKVKGFHLGHLDQRKGGCPKGNQDQKLILDPGLVTYS